MAAITADGGSHKTQQPLGEGSDSLLLGLVVLVLGSANLVLGLVVLVLGLASLLLGMPSGPLRVQVAGSEMREEALEAALTLALALTLTLTLTPSEATLYNRRGSAMQQLPRRPSVHLPRRRPAYSRPPLQARPQPPSMPLRKPCPQPPHALHSQHQI